MPVLRALEAPYLAFLGLTWKAAAVATGFAARVELSRASVGRLPTEEEATHTAVTADGGAAPHGQSAALRGGVGWPLAGL